MKNIKTITAFELYKKALPFKKDETIHKWYSKINRYMIYNNITFTRNLNENIELIQQIYKKLAKKPYF